MNGAIIVTKIITSLHTIFCHIKSECSHYHWAPGLMLQPPIAKWSLSRLYKWEKIICLEAALHFSPIIQLISEVAHAARRANGPMIHMWNDTPLYNGAILKCTQCHSSNPVFDLTVISFKRDSLELWPGLPRVTTQKWEFSKMPHYHSPLGHVSSQVLMY